MSWSSKRYNFPRPEGSWRGLERTSGWVEIVGAHFASGAEFVEHVRFIGGVGQVEVELLRDPNNIYDKNAIAVWGKIVTNNQEVFCAKIGYIPREVAAMIATTYSIRMPLAARLVKVRASGQGDARITIEVLTPKRPELLEYIVHV